MERVVGQTDVIDADVDATTTTPRNPDGTISFDARRRHTPRSTRDETAEEEMEPQPQPSQPPQHAQSQSQSQPQPQEDNNVSLLDEQTSSEVKELSSEEIEELHDMFLKYDYNSDGHLALEELGSFLAELEFTYSDEFVQTIIDHVCGKHVRERRTIIGRDLHRRNPSLHRPRVPGALTFDEFLEFMRVFYWLHDHVCQEIERQFLEAFHKEVSDEVIAILCSFVRFTADTELDFNEMNEKLVQAVNEEAERARMEEEERRRAAGDLEQGEHEPSPLAQQHFAQARREEEEARLEMERRRRLEAEAAAAEEEDDSIAGRHKRQQAEEKRRLQQQREYFNRQASLQAAAVRGGKCKEEYGGESKEQVEDTSQDPFAVHDEQAQQPHQLQQKKRQQQLHLDTTSRLALSLDHSDDVYLHASWKLLLKYLDPHHRGGLALEELGVAFRAMGLDPSPEQLEEFFRLADRDRSGLVNEEEFREYYSKLYQHHLRAGMELGQVQKVFERFDEDGDGRVTIPEFKHVVKTLLQAGSAGAGAGSKSNVTQQISAIDVDRLCKLADSNGDGEVDFKEFLNLIRLSAVDTEEPGADAEGGHRHSSQFIRPGMDPHSAEVARHEQMLAFRAARALTRKIIRAHMPSPLEHLLAFIHMPSNFRPSMLSKFDSEPQTSLAHAIQPVLHHAGMHYTNLQLDPRTLSMRPVPCAPLAADQSTEPEPFGEHAAQTYHIELEYASGIPIPDVRYRKDIVARRCRICVLEHPADSSERPDQEPRPLSNLHIVKAEWEGSTKEGGVGGGAYGIGHHAAAADRWRFALRFNEQDWNVFALKTAERNCTVMFELTCLIKKGTEQGQVEERDPSSSSSYLEMSCGFARLDLSRSTSLLKATRLLLDVYGGNMSAAISLADQEALARKSGWKAWFGGTGGAAGVPGTGTGGTMSPGSTTPGGAPSLTTSRSHLCIKISPARLKDDRVANYLRFLPCNILVSWSQVEVLKLFLELVASFVCLPHLQPLRIGRSAQLAIRLFLRLASGPSPDLLQVLAEVWSEKRKSMKKVALKEHDTGAMSHAYATSGGGTDAMVGVGGAGGGGGGSHTGDDASNDTTSASVLRRFRSCILSLYPCVSLANDVLPDFILGVTDLQRLSLLRLMAHAQDPAQVLTSDGMIRGNIVPPAQGSPPIIGSGSPSLASTIAPPGVTRAPMTLARATSVQAVKADVASAAVVAAQMNQAALMRRNTIGGSASMPVKIGGPIIQVGSGAHHSNASANPNASVASGPITDPYAGSVEFKNIWAPFHTNEVAYDPNEHSEDYYWEQHSDLSMPDLQIQPMSSVGAGAVEHHQHLGHTQ